MSRSFPARLHVLLASASPVGVILRRGPTNHVCSVLWDRRADRFHPGQWFCGRIYERRSDISPDGRHLIYFARNARCASETRGSWTAISRAPWLNAIVLWGKGDCWQGGGLFTSNSRYWLNGCHFLVRRGEDELRQDPKFRPVGEYGAECEGVYFIRLQRDGWILKERMTAGNTSRLTVFEKTITKGWILRKYAHADVTHPAGSGCYWDEHELENPAGGCRLALPGWEWADADGEALVWAEAGRLNRAPLETTRLGAAQVLYDFNPMRFEAIAAPY